MGSFLLVVGERWSNDKSIIKPRSHCDNCQYFLHWYELIPIISYIFLRGRCKNCGKKISILCPIIELITGLVYAFSYCYFGLTSNFIIALVLFSFFIVTCVSDFKYLVILDIPLLITCFIVLLVYMYDKGVNYFLLSLLSGFICDWDYSELFEKSPDNCLRIFLGDIHILSMLLSNVKAHNHRLRDHF